MIKMKEKTLFIICDKGFFKTESDGNAIAL